jgi:uncharacterized membrane protein YjjP (DUF1212 family)
MQAATMLHRYGTPSHRLERVMKQVSQSIGVQADYLYTPTALLVSFSEGLHRTELRRIDAGDANLGKLIEFDMALEQLEAGRAGIHETRRLIDTIDAAPPRFSFPLVLLSGAIASGCATVFLGGGIGEVLFAVLMGAVIQLFGYSLKRWAPQEHALEIVGGFISAFSALMIGAMVANFDDRTACLGSLIILVPGFSFTVALMELANRHLSSGVARLAGAAVVFLALICGVALAWRLGSEWRGELVQPQAVPDWLYFTAIFVAPFAFAILFQARIKEWGIIALVAWSGFGVTVLATDWKGAEFGAFLGALVLGSLSNLYARVWDHPALVPQMPATLMLVPGSIGYRSLAAFVDHKGIEGIESAFAMAIVAISIVAGLLSANLIVPPKRLL